MPDEDASLSRSPGSTSIDFVAFYQIKLITPAKLNFMQV